MTKSIAIVTGASRGIGEALAIELLLKGYRVFGIARSTTVSKALLHHDQFTAIACDLSEAEDVEEMINSLFNNINYLETSELLLINNAAMLEPLKPIDQCGPAEMALHLHTNLLAPMILCSGFIRHTREWTIRKRIVNITSGMAEHSAPAMSQYASSKAGLNMLTRCIADEQRSAPHPVEIVAVDPGMADTRMQTTARSQTEPSSPMASFLQSAYEEGKLWTTKRVAEELLRRIEPVHLEGNLLRIYDNEL